MLYNETLIGHFVLRQCIFKLSSDVYKRGSKFYSLNIIEICDNTRTDKEFVYYIYILGNIALFIRIQDIYIINIQ